MIAFFSRWFSLQFLFMMAVALALFIVLGEPTKNNWSPLWEQQFEGAPIVIFIILIITAAAFLTALWMTITILLRDSQASRLLKKANKHELQEKQIKRSPRLLRKSLRQTQTLIETQRKSLQKLSEQRTDRKSTRLNSSH